MYVYSCAIYLTAQVCLCNSIRIVNLYPQEHKHYQLDYNAFIFCFQFFTLHSFPKLPKSRDLGEVVSYICNIIRFFSQILHPILDVKTSYFKYAYIDSLFVLQSSMGFDKYLVSYIYITS